MRVREQLMQKYPNSIKEIILEEFVQDPLTNSRELYDFLGIKMVPQVEAWLRNSSASSVNIAQAWRHKIENSTKVSIEQTCAKTLAYGARIWSDAQS